MNIKKEFKNLLAALKDERELISAQLKKASKEAKKEFEASEEQFKNLKTKVAELAEDSQEASEEVIAKIKQESEELEQTYQRLNHRLAERAITSKEDLQILYETLKVDRDKIKLQLHLASMEVKEEFELAEHKWQHLKDEAAGITKQTKKTSAEFMANSKIVSEELKEAFQRIKQRIS